MRTRPEDYPAIFGQNFANRNNKAVVTIGDRQFTKYDLGEMGCPHIAAAGRLNAVFEKLHATSLEDIARNYSPTDFVALKGFGVTTFYALTCLLRSARLSLPAFYKSKVTVTSLTLTARKKTRKRKRSAA